MNIPYNPFLSGPNWKDQVEVGDHILEIEPDDIPSDRLGFSALGSTVGIKSSLGHWDQDLCYSASNFLGYLDHEFGGGREQDAERISDLVCQDGVLRLILTRLAVAQKIDIRA